MMLTTTTTMNNNVMNGNNADGFEVKNRISIETCTIHKRECERICTQTERNIRNQPLDISLSSSS